MIELIPEGYFDLPDLVRVAIAQKQIFQFIVSHVYG